MRPDEITGENVDRKEMMFKGELSKNGEIQMSRNRQGRLMEKQSENY